MGMQAKSSQLGLTFQMQKKSQPIFKKKIQQHHLWYPKNKIPSGDKTTSIIRRGYHYFFELFTERNLLALAYLYKEISKVKDIREKQFLYFAFSASLKWASKQCHLRGDVVEGWAMHAYWIYPKHLEINVWKTFVKRIQAVVRGKKYLERIEFNAHEAQSFEELVRHCDYLILNQSADNLDIPAKSVDCIITDPPYGGNVNYAELSDFWTIWNPTIRSIVNKKNEAVINKTQSKDLARYEELLAGVFSECQRVLKPHGALVATFNSIDLIIVSAFLKAVALGGFELVKDGLHYQEPIKAYTTTVHAKEVGAFTGDFIFTFKKSKRAVLTKLSKHHTWQQTIDRTITRHAKHSRTEIEFRRGVYEQLIPLLADWVYTSNGQMNTIARYAEQQMRKQEFQALEFHEARSIAR